MIYTLFVVFLVAFTTYLAAPTGESGTFPLWQDALLLGATWVAFWLLCRRVFTRMGRLFQNQMGDSWRLRQRYARHIHGGYFFTILVFAAELYLLDLKAVLHGLPLVDQSEFLSNCLGILVFLVHLGAMWYWAYEGAGRHIEVADNPWDFIAGQVKFNFIIVVPWLLLSLLTDALTWPPWPWFQHAVASPSFQIGFYAAYILFTFLVLAPLLAAWVWDCTPLEDPSAEADIQDFLTQQNVQFTRVLSWNALNRGLITAAVIGALPKLRFLLITPGLMRLMNRNELRAVVCHETGHVKRGHLAWYFLLLITFILINMGLFHLIMYGLFGYEYLFQVQSSAESTVLSLTGALVFLASLLFFIRFIFSFFMRNFERQADLHCFRAGVDPVHLISAFAKLRSMVGDDGKKTNWHHYNIPQRMDFLEQAMRYPQLVQRHDRKVRAGLVVFFAAALGLAGLVYQHVGSILSDDVGYWEAVVQAHPDDPTVLTNLAMLYYEDEQWNQSLETYEKALSLDRHNATALNNLAWLLLTCPDESLRDPARALPLARDATELATPAFILDTLAEAYFQNGLLEQAVTAAREAVKAGGDDPAYHREQLEKMEQALRTRGDEGSGAP